MPRGWIHPQADTPTASLFWRGAISILKKNDPSCALYSNVETPLCVIHVPILAATTVGRRSVQHPLILLTIPAQDPKQHF